MGIIISLILILIALTLLKMAIKTVVKIGVILVALAVFTNLILG